MLLAVTLAAFVIQIRIAWADNAASTGAIPIVEALACEQIFMVGLISGTFGLLPDSWPAFCNLLSFVRIPIRAIFNA